MFEITAVSIEYFLEDNQEKESERKCFSEENQKEISLNQRESQ